MWNVTEWNKNVVIRRIFIDNDNNFFYLMILDKTWYNKKLRKHNSLKQWISYRKGKIAHQTSGQCLIMWCKHKCSKNVSRFFVLYKAVFEAIYGDLTTGVDSCISYVSTSATLINNSLSGLICSILLMSLSSKQYVHNRNKRAIHTKAATDHTV